MISLVLLYPLAVLAAAGAALYRIGGCLDYLAGLRSPLRPVLRPLGAAGRALERAGASVTFWAQLWAIRGWCAAAQRWPAGAPRYLPAQARRAADRINGR